MRDETLIEPFAAPEFYVDGFSDHHTIGGNFFFAGYRIQPSTREGHAPLKVVVARFVCPIDTLPTSLAQAMQTIEAASGPLALVMPLRKPAH